MACHKYHKGIQGTLHTPCSLNLAIQIDICKQEQHMLNVSFFWRAPVFISKKTKQYIFAHTSAFLLFSPVHTNAFSFENSRFLRRFRLSSARKRLKTLSEATVYDAYFVTVFRSLRFHPSTQEMGRFQYTPLLKPFSKVSVFISVFGRFSVDNRRKRIKTYPFSHKNALEWTRPKNQE